MGVNFDLPELLFKADLQQSFERIANNLLQTVRSIRFTAKDILQRAVQSLIFNTGLESVETGYNQKQFIQNGH